MRIRGTLPLFGGSSSGSGEPLKESNIVVSYPDDALRPGDNYGGRALLQGAARDRERGGPHRDGMVYGPCATGSDEYRAFEHLFRDDGRCPYGPYREYGPCDADRKQLKAARPAVEGHCVSKPKVIFRMTRDGSLVVSKDAPPIE